VPDMNYLQFFATLGVGGVLAGLMFHFYRQDMARHISEWKGQAELLMMVVKENTAAHTVSSSTNTMLVGVIQALHTQMVTGGRRATDIQADHAAQQQRNGDRMSDHGDWKSGGR